MKIAIVGAGVAGLTTALLMRDSRHEVIVYERAEELIEVGAGIQLGPNAVRILQKAGIGPALAEASVATTSLEGRDWETGRNVFHLRYADETTSKYGAPYYVCHRAALQRLLQQEVGDSRIALGKEVVSVEPDEDGVGLRFADQTEVRADLVVGADGIRSRLRGLVMGDEPPVFSGMAAYRGNIGAEDAKGADLGREMVKWWGPTPDHHMVMYRLVDGSVNFVGVVPEREWESDSWIAHGDLAELRDRFAGFAAPVTELLSSVAVTYKWALYDRQVAPGWSAGRIVLLGDACHAMLPFLAQGAAQAIEDACILARCLELVPDQNSIAEALASYEHVRLDRVSKVHQATRGHSFFSASTKGDYVDWLYRYDATSVPLSVN